MNSQKEYLLINPKDALWGLCVTSTGYQSICRDDVYPPLKNTLSSTYLRRKKGVFWTNTSSSIWCPDRVFSNLRTAS